MNKNNVKNDMDSGLGSDEDRKGRTKEQKQLHNQQLLSGCFIDASSLSDDAEVLDQRRTDERRQGALIFQNSIPNFSMLQMPNSTEERDFDCASGNMSNFPETSTPYNSIIQLDLEEQEAARKSPLGFYVDLNDVADVPETPPANSTKKNIFSMVIDFEAPKKGKPTTLSSSFSAHKKKLKSNGLGSGSLSSSYSSINSYSVAGTSRQSEEQEKETVKEPISISILSASLVKNLSLSSKSSSSSENVVIEKNNEDSCDELLTEIENLECDKNSTKTEGDNNSAASLKSPDNDIVPVQIEEKHTVAQAVQFVKLSDLECQKPRVDLNFTPRMSRSIPESHWVESPLLMSRSAGYRSAPHPLEPENDELSDSDTISSLETSRPRKAVRRLGTDLLRMFLEEVGPDVVVEVDGHKLKAHKCILASRCQYFAALLSGNWLEKSGNVISLQGFSYESVYFSLCHIYSGAAHVPDSISLLELASLADMLGLEGLKEVVEHALKQRHCHSFHKPCAGCCTGVLEVLPLSAAYGLDDLYQKCLQWITQHFVRVWPSRAFASLPRELREKCYQQHVVHMAPDRVLETIMACDKILATLPTMRWSEPISQLVSQLTDACHLYHRQHFSAVLGSPSFLAMDTGLGFSVCQVEDQMLSAAKNLGVEQACRSYSRCWKMLDQIWSRPFADLLHKIKHQLEQCLVRQSDRLIRSNAWLRLDTVLRTRIKELTPGLEPASRLPRSTILNKKKTVTNTKQPSPILSSSDSSRNSSPGMNQRMQTSAGSPSLRRSLLLAASAPQVPPSPSTHRRSTLTQPTAASAAKSAPSKNVKPAPKNPPTKTFNSKPAPTKPTPARKQVTISRNSSTNRKESPLLTTRKVDSRCSSPLKNDSRTSSPRKFDSRVTSPVVSNVRSPSPMKKMGTPSPRINTKMPEPKPAASAAAASVPAPSMQRSGTFLKDEPTVLGKVI
ncbi:unnamed protein product [Brassicogethes aeneus]|uniref:BTB domain-containing protein n=1 Tax=Brassicogethes aeneus TaxID=1431903 RepID=A0A9P0FAV3_BRAAE|nr:unnamed protein product [Brassicogethes aeneus]